MYFYLILCNQNNFFIEKKFKKTLQLINYIKKTKTMSPYLFFIKKKLVYNNYKYIYN